MAKKNITVEEAVGDTSGYQEKKSWDKKRKITLISSLVGIVLVIVISIFLFTTPRKIDFKFEDGATNAVRYEVNKHTNLLIDAPKDPKRTFFEFKGWFTDKECTNGGYFNNDKDKSLTEVNLDGINALFAKWEPVKYEISYDFDIYPFEPSYAKNPNPDYITIKHEATSYEINEFAESLRQKDPDKYVTGKDAIKNLNRAIEIFKDTSKLSERVLAEPSYPGYTFVNWVDQNGKVITTLSQTDPQSVKLTAQWA